MDSSDLPTNAAAGHSDPPEWGQFTPPRNAGPLRALINAGCARGFVRKWIIRKWIEKFGLTADLSCSGVRYRLILANNITDLRVLTSHKSYDRAEIDALKAAVGQGTFVDLGANIGFYSLSIAATGARVIAVEPNPKTLERLRFNVAINDFAGNVTVIPVGIGEEGEFELISSGDLGSASIGPNQTKNERTIATRIRTRPLLDILSEADVESIEGLKIDIEGMEDRALIPFFNDAPKSLRPKCVVIEDCTSDYWETDVIAYMQSIGYTMSFKTRANSVLKLTQPG